MAETLPEGTVTILFTDVVGSTALWTSRGDAAAQEIMRVHFDLVRKQVQEHSGQEVKTIGDGFMVAFASARRAVACAVALQRALGEHNRKNPQQEVGVRMGLNTGEAIRQEADFFGEAVNAAARIAAKATGGQILVSETVKGVLGRLPDSPLVDRGRFRLKGFPERWRLHEVVWQEQAIPAAPAIAERTPFVGREAERAELRRLLERAAAGQGALVLLGGEPGVGKTRLAEELMAEARQRNMTALLGRCYEMEGAPPYIPFVEILEAAVRLFPLEALRSTVGESAPDVARLLPELRQLFSDIPDPVELPPEQERRVLFNGLREFIARAGRAQPLLLVLDDLHWADDSTMLLVQHIAQRLHEMPVLILGTYRDVELDVARPLARALDELVRQRLAHDMSIKRLPEDGVAAMLRSLSGQEPPALLVQAIYGETEGNAFFVEEVFKYLAEEGRLFGPSGKDFRSDFPIGELEVPRGVRLVISRRLERVSEECRGVLTAAAVVGRGFSFDLLQALGDVEADALLDAVDEAERAHLITSAADGAAQTGAGMGEARFTFAHELIRQTLVSGVSLPRRQRLHLRVAEAMERVYARALEEHAADLAHHLYQAGTAADPAKTVRYLTLAGQREMAQVAWEAAAAHYERALQAMDLVASPDERVRVDVLLALGMALGRGGADRPRVRAVFQRAAELARSAGDSERCARAALGFAALWPTAGVVEADVVRLLEEALQLLGPAESALRARVLARLGQELYFSEERDRGKQLVADALQMARRIDDPETLAYVLRYVVMGEVDAARMLSLVREQIEAASRSGDRYAVLYAHGDLVRSMLVLGDRAGLDRAVEEEERLQRELRALGGWIGLHRALQARMDGRFETAERLAGQAFAEMPHNDTVFAQSFGLVILGLRGHQGRLLEMEPAIRAAAQQYPGIPAYRAALASVYSVDVRRREDARAVFDELAEHGFGRLPSDGNLPITLSLLADVCWSLGDAARASELYEMLSPREGECVVNVGWAVVTWGAASRSLALLAATMRRWEDAERHFEDALRMNAKLGDKPWLAHTRHDYARMLIDRNAPGDRDKAFRLLTEAIAMYREIGMPTHLEMAEGMLREC